MVINLEAKEFVVEFDNKMQTHLANKHTDKMILISMVSEMPDIKKVMNSVSRKELDEFCQNYDGFHYFMKLLEKLATGVADGKINY